jgi:hypothetical protein
VSNSPFDFPIISESGLIYLNTRVSDIKRFPGRAFLLPTYVISNKSLSEILFHSLEFIADMSQVAKQFNRVQRTFLKVLDNHNRKLVDYEDDVWGFVLNCWHLMHWIKNDTKSVAKATRVKIDNEVNSYPALVIVGELANKSKNIELISNVMEEGGKDHEEILLTVADRNGDEFPVKKLATDAMKNWMAIIKKYRI